MKYLNFLLITLALVSCIFSENRKENEEELAREFVRCINSKNFNGMDKYFPDLTDWKIIFSMIKDNSIANEHFDYENNKAGAYLQFEDFLYQKRYHDLDNSEFEFLDYNVKKGVFFDFMWVKYGNDDIVEIVNFAISNKAGLKYLGNLGNFEMPVNQSNGTRRFFWDKDRYDDIDYFDEANIELISSSVKKCDSNFDLNNVGEMLLSLNQNKDTFVFCQFYNGRSEVWYKANLTKSICEIIEK